MTSIGCVMWGVCTAGFSVCRSLNEGYLFWAINGIGLSLVIPTGQSLIADYYQVGSMICKLLCNSSLKELYSNLRLYAPDPLGQHIFHNCINLEKMQCVCVQTRQPEIGDNRCQASKHMLCVVDHALVLCIDIMQNADNGYTGRCIYPSLLLEYHMMPAELSVRWHSTSLHAECQHNNKKYSFATRHDYNE